MKLKSLILCFVVIGSYNGQTMKEKYANRLYEEKQFFRASEVYAELVDASVEKGQPNSLFCVRAAESAIANREYENALSFYKLVNTQQLSVKDLSLYLNALLVCKKYDQAVNLVQSTTLLANSKRGLGIVKDFEKSILSDSSLRKVKVLSINSSEGDFGMIINNGKAWFTSARKPVGLMSQEFPWDNSFYLKIYTAEYQGGFIFDSPMIQPELLTKYHDGPVCFSPDGKQLFVTRNSIQKGTGAKFLSLVEYILDRSGNWVEKGSFIHNMAGINTGQAFITSTGRMYFVSDREGGFGGSDIYFCDPLENGGWSEPVNVGPVVNTPNDEFFPAVDTEGKLFFASNGLVGLGGFDIYSLALGEQVVFNMGYPINTNRDDFSYFPLSTNEGVFSSDREGKDRMYGVTITPAKGILILSCIDVDSNKKILDGKVVITDQDGVVQTCAITEGGSWESELLPGKKYTIRVEKENFSTKTIDFDTRSLRQSDTININALLQQEFIDILLTVHDKETNEPIPNASGTLTNLKGEVVKYESDYAGNATVKLKIGGHYDLYSNKKGYIDLSGSLDAKSGTIGQDLLMTEIKKDVSFEIKNILYDFSKYDLRPESTIELDKLSEFLTVNGNITVELSSHTDSRGTDQANQVLSQKRAESCVLYLISKGIDKSRIIAKGYGESKPVNNCTNGVECSEEDFQLNRRTELKILKI